MNWVEKTGTAVLGLLLVTSSFITLDKQTLTAATEKDEHDADMSKLEKEGLFPAMDEEGNVTYIPVKGEDKTKELALPEKQDEDTTFDLKRTYANGESETIASYDSFSQANAALTRQSFFRSANNTSLAVYTNDQVRSVTNGVVNFKTKGCDAVTYFTEEGTNQRGSINGCYGADGAYLGTNADGTKVKFKMAGVTGWVNKADVEIRDYDNNKQVQSISYYYVKNGRIYHAITIDLNYPNNASVIDVGPMQSYMKEGEYYYSYDGHYFYRTYALMSSDYKKGIYSHAINANNPYYNYYQYLSFRSKTNITGDDFNKLIANVKGSSSVLYNQGNNYIKHQNTYGTNAALIMGVSINESAWGTSNYAVQRNNIFGLNAYDSDPDQASKFPSVSECIRQFAQTHVSINYLDPNDVSGLYHGPCLGDKSVGMAVKYATAPYWGETNASFAYRIERSTGKNVDYGNYTIGIKENGSTVNIRKEPNTSSKVLYQSGPWNNYPFLILDKVKGQSVDGNTTWYKIATDAPLNSSRTQILRFAPNQGGEYDANVSYAYISETTLQTISYGKYAGNTPAPDPGPQPDPTPGYKKGDVNEDGKITTIDYIYVKNHILKLKELTGSAAKAADVNGDGKITTYDYIMIKNDILGISKIN